MVLDHPYPFSLFLVTIRAYAVCNEFAVSPLKEIPPLFDTCKV